MRRQLALLEAKVSAVQKGAKRAARGLRRIADNVQQLSAELEQASQALARVRSGETRAKRPRSSVDAGGGEQSPPRQSTCDELNSAIELHTAALRTLFVEAECVVQEARDEAQQAAPYSSGETPVVESPGSPSSPSSPPPAPPAPPATSSKAAPATSSKAAPVCSSAAAPAKAPSMSPCAASGAPAPPPAKAMPAVKVAPQALLSELASPSSHSVAGPGAGVVRKVLGETLHPPLYAGASAAAAGSAGVVGAKVGETPPPPPPPKAAKGVAGAKVGETPPPPPPPKAAASSGEYLNHRWVRYFAI
jgi:hypothetical protein